MSFRHAVIGMARDVSCRPAGTSAALAIGLAAAMTLCAPAVCAQTYKVSVGEIPATPILLEILKSIESANPGVKLEVTVRPFPRSLKAVLEDRAADFHYPFIRPANEASVLFDVSTEPAFRSPFMIYENKNKPLDMSNPQQYKIETDMGHTGVFAFPAIGSGDIAASLRKVDAGRIDGYIFDELSTDEQLVAGEFKNIHRKLYAWVDACFVLPKGSKGGSLDLALTKIMENAKNNQSYKDAYGKLKAMYKGEEWQQ